MYTTNAKALAESDDFSALLSLIFELTKHRQKKKPSNLLEPHWPQVGYLHIMTCVFSADGKVLAYEDRTISKTLVIAAHPELTDPTQFRPTQPTDALTLEFGENGEYSITNAIFQMDHRQLPVFYPKDTYVKYSVFSDETKWAGSISVNNRVGASYLVYPQAQRTTTLNDGDGLTQPPTTGSPSP